MSEEVEIEVMTGSGYNTLKAPAKLWIEAIYNALNEDQKSEVRAFLYDRAEE